jgi:hypothetical protein
MSAEGETANACSFPAKLPMPFDTGRRFSRNGDVSVYREHVLLSAVGIYVVKLSPIAFQLLVPPSDAVSPIPQPRPADTLVGDRLFGSLKDDSSGTLAATAILRTFYITA